VSSKLLSADAHGRLGCYREGKHPRERGVPCRGITGLNSPRSQQIPGTCKLTNKYTRHKLKETLFALMSYCGNPCLANVSQCLRSITPRPYNFSSRVTPYLGMLKRRQTLPSAMRKPLKHKHANALRALDSLLVTIYNISYLPTMTPQPCSDLSKIPSSKPDPVICFECAQIR
jgi:hypothetical protein